MTVKKDGKVTATGRIVVSADGKSRTVTTSGTDAEGVIQELLGLPSRTDGATPSVGASEGLREIAWENDRRFA